MNTKDVETLRSLCREAADLIEKNLLKSDYEEKNVIAIRNCLFDQHLAPNLHWAIKQLSEKAANTVPVVTFIDKANCFLNSEQVTLPTFEQCGGKGITPEDCAKMFKGPGKYQEMEAQFMPKPKPSLDQLIDRTRELVDELEKLDKGLERKETTDLPKDAGFYWMRPNNAKFHPEKNGKWEMVEVRAIGSKLLIYGLEQTLGEGKMSWGGYEMDMLSGTFMDGASWIKIERPL